MSISVTDLKAKLIYLLLQIKNFKIVQNVYYILIKLSSEKKYNLLFEEVKNADNPLVYIYTPNHNLIFPKFKNFLFKNKIKTLFSDAVLMDRFTRTDKEWSKYSWISSLSYTEREDDDLLYATCQDLVREIVDHFTLDDEELDSYLKIMNETISLRVSDFYVTALRNVIMLLEDCKNNNYDKIVICMNDLKFAVLLKNILELNGYQSVILKPINFSQKKFEYSLSLYSQKDFRVDYKVLKKNVDFNRSFETLRDSIKTDEKFIYTPFKGYVKAFSNPMIYISEYMDKYHFYTVDTISKKDFDFNVNNINVPNNFNFISLSDKTCYLEEEQVNLIVNNIYEAIDSINKENIIYQNFKLGHFFYRFNINQIINQTISSMYYYKLHDKLFQEKRPFAILASPSRTIEARAIIVAAKKHNIRTFDLQGGGAIFKSRRFWKSEADHLLCSDLLSKNILQELYGFEDNHISIVGSPQLDHDIAKYKEMVYREDNIYKKIFLVLQPLSTEVNLKIVNTCLEAIKGIDNVELTVGFHPRDKDIKKKAIIDNAQDEFIVSNKGSLQALTESDICITYYSFMGVEAFALGCKVIALNVLESKRWPYRLKLLGLADEAYSADELRELILSNENSIINKSALVLKDGLSVDRISKVLMYAK